MSGGGVQGSFTQQIWEVGLLLLKDFIYEVVQQHFSGDAAVTRDQLGAAELTDPQHKMFAHCLQLIRCELDGNVDLQKVINGPSITPSKNVFITVALELFSDGKFNWGRVVALFYFACRLVIKGLVTKIPEIVRTVITWTMNFLQEHVISWIRDQGGWEGIRSHFGTPMWQMVGVFLAGVLTTVIVMRKM